MSKSHFPKGRQGIDTETIHDQQTPCQRSPGNHAAHRFGTEKMEGKERKKRKTHTHKQTTADLHQHWSSSNTRLSNIDVNALKKSRFLSATITEKRPFGRFPRMVPTYQAQQKTRRSKDSLHFVQHRRSSLEIVANICGNTTSLLQQHGQELLRWPQTVNRLSS